MAQPSGSSSRANLSDDFTRKHFIELCLNEVNNGYRSGATLKPAAWVRIAEGLDKAIGQRLQQKQLKNAWDYLKRQYQIWTKLTTTTGHGYNSLTHTINWPNERWEEYLKNHPEARQFRYKPLAYCEKLKQLFDGVLATGLENLSSGMEDIPQVGSTASSFPTSSHSTSFIRQMNENEDDHQNQSIESEVQGSGKKKKRKRLDETHEEISNIIDVLEKDRGPSVEDCIDILRKLMTCHDPLYFVAANALCKRKEYRHFWMSMPSDEERILWIKSLSNKS